MRCSLIVVLCFICSLTSCDKKRLTENAITFNSAIHNVHIICDARITGKVEPWLFEFAVYGSFNTNSDGWFYNDWVGIYILDTTYGSATVQYLVNAPLLDMKNLTRIIKPANIADTAYTHYEFDSPAGFTGKDLFRIKDHHSVSNGVYKVGEFIYPYADAPITIILSTNIPIEEAVRKANEGLQDSLLSKHKFTNSSR